jgi:hypothetical protein
MAADFALYQYTVQNGPVDELAAVLGDPSLTDKAKHTCLYTSAVLGHKNALGTLIPVTVTTGDDLLFTKELFPGDIHKTSYSILELLCYRGEFEYVRELVRRFDIQVERNAKLSEMLSGADVSASETASGADEPARK